MASKTWSQTVIGKQVDREADKCLEVKNEDSFVSLDDVMSEQLVQNLSTEEEEKPKNDTIGCECSGVDTKVVDFLEESGLELSELSELLGNECLSDELLARCLQRELDREHDLNLKKEEKNLNQNSKVSISFDLYRRAEEAEDESDEDVDHEFGEESKHWDSFERSEKQAVRVGRQGFAVKDGVVHTKHDLETTARKNARKAMAFDLKTGDGGAIDMRLNNSVYNALKVHSISEGKRMARLHEKKEKSTAEKVLDEKSRILVFKLVNRGLLQTVNGVIATGKESVVLHGRGSLPERGITDTEVAIKIFKTTLNEFRNRVQYIGDDPVLHVTSRLSKQNPKFMIPLWAEKEMHNLHRMRRNGVSCPEVLILKKHVLVMTFIGNEGKPAPTLKDVVFDESDLALAWKQTVQLMAKLYKECDLVHADFSEYNLLWHQKKVFCIDVSQAVLTTHPMAFKFLWRDCQNIQKFFAKRCLPEVISASELFTKVCGKQLDSNSIDNEYNSVDLLDKIENYDRSEELIKYGESEDPFEDMLEKSVREKQELRTSGAKSPQK